MYIPHNVQRNRVRWRGKLQRIPLEDIGYNVPGPEDQEREILGKINVQNFLQGLAADEAEIVKGLVSGQPIRAFRSKGHILARVRAKAPRFFCIDKSGVSL